MLKNFENYIESQFPFLKQARSVIAVSGGVDSVVLTHLCKEVGLDFAIAHCNFNLRGEESNADEDFVIELGENLDVEVFIQNFETEVYAKEYKRSIQMAARELRYEWFSELSEQLKFDYIFTAHHADDNLETFLINFTRGTGLNGLTGIPEINDNILRPLLKFSRVDIEAYAMERNIKWREDSSNSSRKYLRNKLRHEVVPILKEINPQLLDSFQSTLDNLNDTADIVSEATASFFENSLEPFDGLQLKLRISEFKKTKNPKAYLYAIFHSYGFTEWGDIVNLLDGQSGKYVLSKKYRLIKDREHLILTGLKSDNKEVYSIDSVNKKDNSLKTTFGDLNFKVVKETDYINNDVLYVDKDKLRFPLEIRVWGEGDRFQPFGMKGQKKVSKYLKDEKLSIIDKENTWVLVSDNKVVWVVGRRADDRFKVTDTTKQILKIELN